MSRGTSATIHVISGKGAERGFASRRWRRTVFPRRARLVVARFGYSRPPDFGIDDDLALIGTGVRTSSPQR